MQLVVQTYPAHFYQTLCCLRSLRRLGANDPIWLFVDDISNFSWPGYTGCCRDIYQDLVDHIVTFSDVPGLYRMKSWPWLRQQTNKLLLDKILPATEWLFIDGDVHLNRWPPDHVQCASVTAYTGQPLTARDPQPGEMSSQTLFYVRHMLGIPFDGFWTDDDRYITSSHPPVKIMQAELLADLRHHVEQRFGQSLVDVQLALAHDQRMAACEWDLIEAYRQKILGHTPNWYFDNDFFETTWSADRELGLRWFASRDIAVDPAIWALLPEGKNYL